MEPWISESNMHNHIHEKPKDPHKVTRYIVAAGMAWGFLLTGVAAVGMSGKETCKRVVRRVRRKVSKLDIYG